MSLRVQVSRRPTFLYSTTRRCLSNPVPNEPPKSDQKPPADTKPAPHDHHGESHMMVCYSFF